MNYPTEFPAAEVRSLISTLKDGIQPGDVKQAAYDAWWIQGWAQGTLIGQPSEEGPLMRAALDGADSVAQINELLCLCGREPAMEGALTDLAIKLLLEQLAKVLMDLIDGWMRSE